VAILALTHRDAELKGCVSGTDWALSQLGIHHIKMAMSSGNFYDKLWFNVVNVIKMAIPLKC
jgi:hypothetical protein